MSKEKKTIKDLPMRIYRALTVLLGGKDNVSHDWQSLMVAAEGRIDYKAHHSTFFKDCPKPAEALLEDMRQRMVTVDELYLMLRSMDSREAMHQLRDHVSVATQEEAESTGNVVRPEQESPVYHNDLVPLPLGGVIQLGRQSPVLLPPPPPPPSTELQKCEANLADSVMNMDWLLRETSSLQKDCIGGSCYGMSFQVMPPGGGAKVVVRQMGTEANHQVLPALCTLEHPNLCRVLGYLPATPLDSHVYVIRQLALGRSLDSLLKHMFKFHPATEAGRWPAWRGRLGVARGVASGLAYLHRKGLWHGHLVSSNVMVTIDSEVTERNVQLTDHGLAGALPGEDSTEASRQQSQACTAPEVQRSGVFTTPGDAYTYGTILLELLTGLRNLDSKREGPKTLYAILEALIDCDHPDLEQVCRVACKKAEWPKDTVGDLFSFACLCLNFNASKRPKMDEMVDQLEALL